MATTDTERLTLLELALRDAYPQLLYIVRHGCPCGARQESLNTHPHVGGCGIAMLLELAKK
jgi:hypothetical protein